MNLADLGVIATWLTLAFGATSLFKGPIRPLVLRLHLMGALLALGVLAWGHLGGDFSLLTVFLHTHTTLPLLYRLGALWASPEGSFLLWCTFLSLWCVWIQSGHSATAPPMAGFMLILFWGTLGAFMTPFTLLSHTPTEGLSLNPLLQDPSLLIHPPLLYAGQTGLLSAFLMPFVPPADDSLSQRLLLALRISWSLLTVGLALGSFWAYYELGWGGWWFWDPVENLALVPWLCATALLHFLRAPRLRNAPLSGTYVLLTCLPFCTVVWAMALIRSGLLTSVHSFAPHPQLTLPLLFLSVMVAWPPLIRATQAALRTFRSPVPAPPSDWYGIPATLSLLLACALVTLMTLLPLIQRFGGSSFLPQEVTLGEKAYNTLLLCIMAGPLVLMPVCLLGKRRVPWSWGWVILALFLMLWAAHHMPPEGLKASLSLGLALWIAGGTLHLLRTQPRAWPLVLAHGGVALLLGGIGWATLGKQTVTQHLTPGQTFHMGGHDLTLNKVEHTHAPASQTTTAFLTLDNKHVVSPERRLHHPQNLLTCETALQVFSDGSILQVTLGDPASEQGWYVHATLDPGVLWIWIGAFLMALGGATTALRKRFFKNPKPGNGPQAESPQRIPSKRGET